MKTWLSLALQKQTIARSLKVSAVVGTLLVLINHFDVLASCQLDGLIIAKILLTYLVPYSVATYAAVAALLPSRQTRL